MVLRDGDFEGWKTLVDNGYRIAEDDVFALARLHNGDQLANYYIKMRYNTDGDDGLLALLGVYGTWKEVTSYVRRSHRYRYATQSDLDYARSFLFLRPVYDKLYFKSVIEDYSFVDAKTNALRNMRHAYGDKEPIWFDELISDLREGGVYLIDRDYATQLADVLEGKRQTMYIVR